MIQRSCRASPGGLITSRASCTRRSVLVNEPDFSAKAEAGRMTSAWNAVSVTNRSCTTRCSSMASAPRACCRSGSDIAGFSPSTYMPVISPAWIAFMISTTVSPRTGSSSCPQSFSKAPAHVVAADRLIIRQEHRDQAGVGGALHVVLAAQRMQPRAGTADLPGDQRQRDQAARIIGAVHMLADAHAPEDDGGFRARVHPRHFAQASRPECRRSAPSSPA